jgi:hypothetical protein
MVPKKHKLLELFNKTGIEYHVNDVFEHTGIISMGSLKTVLSEFRKQGIADIKIKFNFVKRVS